MKKWGILLLIILSVELVQAQEFVYDNLPAGQTSGEISYNGKWCNVRSSSYYGTKAVHDCGKPGPASYLYSPVLPSGIYNIYVRWVDGKKFSNNVPVTITNTDYFIDIFAGIVSTITTSTVVSVDETTGGNTWYFVGQFKSVGGEGALSVLFSNENGDVNTDGVRFLRVADNPVPCDPATGIGCQ